MSIEIKKSIKPVNYFDAIKFLEKRVEKLEMMQNLKIGLKL